MWDGAMVTLTELGQAVLDIVGPSCQDVQAMNDRAAKTVFWWNIDEDISMNEKIRQMIAQSQPYKRELSARIGVLARISPDGDLEAADRGTQGSLQRWGQHGLSSAYFPRNNGRARVSAKVTQGMLHGYIRKDGPLNTDRVATALMTTRNNPEYGLKLSLAEIVMGKRLRDVLPGIPKDVMDRDFKVLEGSPVRKSRLQPHAAHIKVLIHSQTRVGVEILLLDQYIVKVYGSGRLTRRKSRFL